MTGGLEFSVLIDQRTFARTMRGIRAFDKDLATATRKRLRQAAKPAVDDVKAHWREGGKSKRGLRAGLARGTKPSIRTAGALTGVTIQTTGPMARPWNARSFRHPVFGNREAWVTQVGNPGFDEVVAGHATDMQHAIVAALNDALRAMED